MNRSGFHRATMAACGLALAFLLAPARAADIRLPDYQALTLDNGATVLLMPRRDVPLVSASVLVRGGSLADAPGREGTAMLLAELMSKGAGGRDAHAFAEAIDQSGGRLVFGSSPEALFANARFLSKDSPLMLSLLGDALLQPHLDPLEFAKVRRRAIDDLVAAKDSDPNQLLGGYARAWLFRDHPYGRPSGGDETSLAAISLDDLRAFQAAQMGGDRLIVAIAGDFDPAETAAQVERIFGGWGKAAAALPQVQPKPRERGRRVLLVDKPGATQTYFGLVNVGGRRGDPQTAAQDIVQTVFGGSFTSMLNTELRVKSGLTYGAGSSLDRQRMPGLVEIGSFTRTESTREAIDLAIATLERLHRDGLDAGTIESAKRYIAGQYAPRLEAAPQLAAKLAELSLYGEDRGQVDGYLGRIAAATPGEVDAARDVFPQSADLAIVAIGDAAKIRETLRRYGPVTEMKISDPRFAPP